jgi:thiamine biosynthesis lipoprotein
MVSSNEGKPVPLVAPGHADVVKRVCRIFNTEIVLAALNHPQPLFDDVVRRLRDYERRFSRFLPGNELATLNDSAGSWVHISADMERLLFHALRVAVESRGTVNIASTNALVRAGYVSSSPRPWKPDGLTPPEPVPALTEVLEVRRRRARLQPGVTVDFGGIAKGFWADEAVEVLSSNAAASLGGDVSARGGGPHGQGWPISIPSGRTVHLHDGGIATSGTSKRRFGRAHHVIDPRTGAPSDSGATQVTVIAKSATTAEWVATAALVSGNRDEFQKRPDVLEVLTMRSRRNGSKQ